MDIDTPTPSLPNYVEKLNALSNYLTLPHPLQILDQTKEPYPVGVGVILSGNTRDTSVNAILPNFLKHYPTPESTLTATRDSMVPLLPGIAHSGSKSDYIKNWAAYIIKNKGTIEPSMDKLTAIVGIGRKTAGVILYRVFGQDKSFPLDTHCLRVLTLLGWFPESKTPKSLEKKLLSIFPEGTRNRSHILLTQHGRHICIANAPQCNKCVLKLDCAFGSTQP